MHMVHVSRACNFTRMYMRHSRWCAYLQGWTLLHYAVHKRNIEMARLLVDAGADVSAKDEKV